MKKNPFKNHSTADIEAVLEKYEREQPETRWNSDIYRAAVDEINARFHAIRGVDEPKF